MEFVYKLDLCIVTIQIRTSQATANKNKFFNTLKLFRNNSLIYMRILRTFNFVHYLHFFLKLIIFIEIKEKLIIYHRLSSLVIITVRFAVLICFWEVDEKNFQRLWNSKVDSNIKENFHIDRFYSHEFS